MKICDFDIIGLYFDKSRWRRLFLPTCALALLSLAASLSSSSEADDALFTRSIAGLERVWGGVLSCASTDNEAEPDDSLANTLEDPSIPTAEDRNYTDCGRQALRSAGSALLLNTLEDAIVQRGLSLFDGNFRIDSSLSWVWGENLRGELDAVVPLWHRDEGYAGHGAALFLQPGVIIWPGLESDDRLNANLGLVYRQGIAPDVVAGGSVFLDYDFRRGHRRLGLGADLQSGIFHGGLNYYQPVSDWREGRDRFEEQALQGLDLQFGAAMDRLSVDGSLGFWRFEGERDERPEWSPSYQLEAGYRVLPGVSLEGGYERHDSDGSLGSSWNVGLAFRFSLPGLEGAESGGGSMAAPNLWSLVERERRILYEERIGVVPAVVSLEPVGIRVSEVAGGTTRTIALSLSRALDRNVSLALDVNGTADLGTSEGAGDITLGYSVAPAASSSSDALQPDAGLCARSGCEIAFAAGETTAELEVAVNDDTEVEGEEYIEIAPQVPSGLAHLLVVGTEPARVAIRPSDDLRIGIAGVDDGDAVRLGGGDTRVMEGDEVHLDLYVGDPAPAGGINLAVAVANRDGTPSTDATIPTSPPRVVAIAEGEQDGRIPVRIASGDGGEPEETITVAISGGEGFDGLEPPWRIDPERESLDLTIAPNENVVAFDDPPDVVSSSAGGRAAGDLGLDLVSALPAGGTILLVSSSSSRIRVPATIRVPGGADRASIPLDQADDTPVGAGGLQVRITVSASDGGLPTGWRFPSGDSIGHTLTLRDQAIGFATRESIRTEESTDQPVRLDVAPTVAPDEGRTISLTVGAAEAPGGSGLTGADYSVSPANLTFTGAGGTAAQAVTVTVNADDEAENEEVVRISLSGLLPQGWVFVNSEHDVRIPANDNMLAFTEGASELAEGGTDDLALTLSNPAPGGGLTVTVTGGGGDLSVDGDAGGSVAVAVPAGATSASAVIPVSATADGTAEDEETVTLVIAAVASSPPGWGAAGAGATHVVTIPANENTIGFASASSTRREGSDDAELPLEIEGTPPDGLSLTVAVNEADGNGEADVATVSSVVIAAGAASAGVPISIVDDGDAEGDETVAITLRIAAPAPTGWDLGVNPVHRITIPANDRMAAFTREVSRAAEGDGGVDVGLTLNVLAPSGGLPLDVVVSNAGTATSGEDFEAIAPSLRVAAGATTARLRIAIIDDDRGEGNETIVLTISEGAGFPGTSGWRIGEPSTHTLTIEDDDRAAGFAAAVSERTEEAGDTNINLLVRAAPAPSSTLNLNVAADGGGTASEGTDYRLETTSVALTGANPTGMVRVAVLADDVAESDETVVLVLTEGSGFAATGYVLGTSRHTITIPANDNAIGFASSSSEHSESSTGVELGLEVVGIPPAGLSLTVSSNSVDVLATSPADIGAGTTAIAAAVVDDETPEDEETAILTIAIASPAPRGWSLGTRDTHTIRIPANDKTVAFAAVESEVTEGETASLALAANFVTPAGLVLNVAVSGGTAGDSDYTVPAGSIAIPAGLRSADIQIATTDDMDFDPGETVIVEISEGGGFPMSAGWSLGTPVVHTLTIADNDAAPVMVGFPSTATASAVGEDVGTHRIVVEVSGPVPRAFIVNATAMEIVGGTRRAVTDNEITVGDLVIPATIGSAGGTAELPVAINPDDDPEDDRVFEITLSDPSPAWVPGGEATHTLTILANDKTVAFAAAESEVIEGGDGEAGTGRQLRRAGKSGAERGGVGRDRRRCRLHGARRRRYHSGGHAAGEHRDRHAR